MKYNIIHICGKDNIDKSLQNKNGYVQFEYVKDELPHLLASADLVVSRAGANVIFELLALRKPNLLIPLSAKSAEEIKYLMPDLLKKVGIAWLFKRRN